MDYYKVLNVGKQSSAKEIKQAWRKLSMIHHPDRNKGVDNDEYKKINAAYEVLSDPKKKNDYDMEQSLPSFLKNSNFSNMNQGNNPFEFINMNSSPDEMFKMFFNTANNINFKQHVPKKITRITQSVTIDDLYNRKSFKIPLNISKNGVIENDEVHFTVDGKFNNGDIIKTKSTQYNDVEIYLKLLHHDLFKKKGINLIYEKTITLVDALVGFSFKLKYLDNQEYSINNNIKVIEPGYKKNIKNMGLYSSGRKGDLIIIFDIMFPEILNEEQKVGLKKLFN
jgi:DnaJ-class molecular chaperone